MTVVKSSNGAGRPVIAGMATMPSRSASFPAALASILDQVDRLYVYLDGHDRVPDAAAGDERIVPIFARDEPGLGCDGKFLALVREGEPFLFVGVDDDLIYPPDHVEHLRQALARQNGPAVVGLHGVTLNERVERYLTDRTVHHFSRELDRDLRVDILGTGTLMFDTSVLSFDPRDWKQINVTDLQVALAAADRGVPMTCVARQADFLRGISEAQADSLYIAMKDDDGPHTRAAQRLLALRNADARG